MRLINVFLSFTLLAMLVLPALGQSSGTGSAKKASGSDTKSTAPVPDSEGEETEAPPLKFTVAGEQLTFEASGDWKRVKPKSRMLEMEIEVPKAEDDPAAGRLTMMGAGGSIDANIQRWEGQFSQADGTATEADTKQMTIEGMKVTMVDIAGTFSQTMGGPFSGGKKVESPDYRMLAAIIETDGEGNYFIKLVGPAATIKANEAEFEKMVKSVKRETVH